MYYRGLTPKFDPALETVVGEIDNEFLLISRQELLQDVDPENYCNQVFKPDLQLNVDFQLVDVEIWKFLHSRYGGTPIKRFFRKSYSPDVEIEVRLMEFKVVVLPTFENW